MGSLKRGGARTPLQTMSLGTGLPFFNNEFLKILLSLQNKNTLLNNSKTFSIFNSSWENKSQWCITLSFKIFKKYLKQYPKNTNNEHNANEQHLTKTKFHLQKLSYQSGLHKFPFNTMHPGLELLYCTLQFALMWEFD